MPTTPPTVDVLPDYPSPDDIANFDDEADAYLGAFPTMRSQFVALGANVFANAVEAATSATTALGHETQAGIYRDEAGGFADDAEDMRDAAAGYAASALGAPGTSATSSTSRALGLGSKAFDLDQTGKLYRPGQYVTAVRRSDRSKRMSGYIDTFPDPNATPPVLTIIMEWQSTTGGPYTDWEIFPSAPPLSSVASQAEAEAGTVNDKELTPLRGAQLVAALSKSAPDVIVQDQRASGTPGGTNAISNGWEKRTLNTVVRNDGAYGSLGSSQVTLQAGVWLLRARAAFHGVGGAVASRIRLYNATDAAAVAQSEGVALGTDGGAAVEAVAVVTITGAKAFEIDAWGTAGASTIGYGAAVATGSVEVHATLEATRLRAS